MNTFAERATARGLLWWIRGSAWWFATAILFVLTGPGCLVVPLVWFWVAVRRRRRLERRREAARRAQVHRDSLISAPVSLLKQPKEKS